MDTKFKNKRVLIFGLGLNQGGVGSANFFAEQGAKVRVTDLKDAEILKSSLEELKRFKNISYTLGQHKYEDINWADLIIKNPAVKPENPYIKYALKKRRKVEQDMGIFLRFTKPSQIIGVTGTKGKSTTASLIYEVLNKSLGVNVNHLPGDIASHVGKNTVLAGNIGTSVLDIIPKIKTDTLIVLEISSFQLEAFDQHQVSPKWAVITNITPDHLNYHQSMNEYVNSKKNIAKHQIKDDFLFIRKNDSLVDNQKFLKGLKSHVIRFSKNNLPKKFHPYLKGEHNLENIAAALKIATVFKIPQKKTLQILSKFKGIPFRMELVKSWHGVKIINDTTATSPEAGIQTIKTFPGSILICGGMNKGMDYKEFAKVVSENVKKVYFLPGDATDLIRAYKPGLQVQTFGPYNNLEKLLMDVKKEVKPDDIILFSPAATSYNLFQNEFDRGRKFNEAVERIFK